MKSKRKSHNKKQNKQKKRITIKGGNNIPTYALNNYNQDPNYMQISARNVVQNGGKGKTKKNKNKNKNKNKKSMIKGGGSFFDFAANQSANSISNFPNNSNNILFGNTAQNSAAYVQPIGQQPYTGSLI